MLTLLDSSRWWGWSGSRRVVEDVEVGDPERQPAVGMERQPVVGMEPLLDPEQAGAPADPEQACRSEADWTTGGRGGKDAPGEEHRRPG